MTLRSTPAGSSRVVALDYKIAQEQALTLGRMGRALEVALAALAAYDCNPTAYRTVRAQLLQDASDALWCFMVQRECCGLDDPRPVLREYRVPAEVQNRMGIFSGAGAALRRLDAPGSRQSPRGRTCAVTPLTSP